MLLAFRKVHYSDYNNDILFTLLRWPIPARIRRALQLTACE